MVQLTLLNVKDLAVHRSSAAKGHKRCMCNCQKGDGHQLPVKGHEQILAAAATNFRVAFFLLPVWTPNIEVILEFATKSSLNQILGMEVVTTVVKGLREIHKLQSSILHQRRVNEKTYLQLMELYLELQVMQQDQTVQESVELQRENVLQKFEEVVNEFVKYLQKYAGMHRVVRIFKIGDMEEERREIVSKVEHIFKILGLVTCATVIKSADTAGKNSASILTKLENMHSDVKLTYDQIHSALLKLVKKRAARRKSLGENNDSSPLGVHDAQKKGSLPRVGVQTDTTTEELSPDTINVVEKELPPADMTVLKLIATSCELEVKAPAVDLTVTKPTAESCELEEKPMYAHNPVPMKVATGQDAEDADSLVSNSSIPMIIDTLDNPEVTSRKKEKTLILLIRMCTSSSNRMQIFKIGGIPILKQLIWERQTFFIQLYALHCLSWFTFVYSKLREAEFEELQSLVQESPRREIRRLVNELQHGDNEEKEIAVIRCSCLATRGDSDILRCVGALPPLVVLLSDGTENQKLWAAEALATLASNNEQNCVEIAGEGAIPALVTLLRSGTDMHKQEAAYALGILAADNDANRSKIAREGAIPPMVAFVRSVTDVQNQWAVYALGCLSLNNEANRSAIAEEGAIPSLVGLVRVGTKAQKQWAAYTIGTLALNDANRVKITLQGAIKPLTAFLRTGTDAQKRWAVYALGNLACSNDETFAALELKQSILPLVELVYSGLSSHKQSAAFTLGNLAANNDDLCAEIGHSGVVAPLVGLLRAGTDDEKEGAAYALECLAANDMNRVAIVTAGAIDLLKALEGTESHKYAERALESLDRKNTGNSSGFSPPKMLSPLVKVLRDGLNSTTATAALESVRDGLFQRHFHSSVDSVPTEVKVGTRASIVAGAW